MKTDLDLLTSFYKKIKEIFNDSIGFKSIGYYFWLMLFLKRYSDVFDEEVGRVVKQDNLSKTAAEFLCFHTKTPLPEEARWSEIVATEKNIGEKIKFAVKLIEEYNPNYGRTLSSTIPIWPQDNVLHSIILEFNNLDLKNASLQKPSLLVDFYDLLKENEGALDPKFEKVLRTVIAG